MLNLQVEFFESGLVKFDLRLCFTICLTTCWFNIASNILLAQDEKKLDSKETINSNSELKAKTDEAKKTASQYIQLAYEASQKATSEKDFPKAKSLFETTLSYCEKAAKAKPSEAQRLYVSQLRSWCYMEMAKSLSNQKELSKPEEVLSYCDQAIEMDSQNWKAYAFRARCYSKKNELKKAIADLDSAIRIKSDAGNLWFNRAELNFAIAQYELAASDYSEAVKLDPNDMQAISGRGHCYTRMKDFKRALLDYNMVVERMPKSPNAYINRGDLFVKMKDFKAAGTDYRSALKIDTSLPAAYLGVAWMYATSHEVGYYNPRVADASVKRAIELAGKETAENLIVLAASQAASGEYSMARDTIKRVQAGKNKTPECDDRLAETLKAKWFIAGSGLKKTTSTSAKNTQTSAR